MKITRQDFIIDRAVEIVQISDKLNGFEYDIEACTDLAVVEIAHVEAEKCRAFIQEIKTMSANHGLLEQVIAEALQQGATPRYL